MFKGSFVALATPFTNSGGVDYDAYDRLVNWQVEQGTHGLVPCGTTGETPTLTHKEHMELISHSVKCADGRVPVIAGAGSNATDEAISLAQHAQKAGADAILTVVPYYNKPCQQGIYQHFKSIHDATDIPLVLYDVPGRTVAKFDVDTVCRLAELPRVVAIKDAAPDLSRPLEMRVRLGREFGLLSGEDSTVAGYLAQGGDGCISVTANAAPKLCAELHTAWQKKDFETFEARRNALSYLHKLMFRSPNPAPAKYALFKMGIINTAKVRLPLIEVGETLRQNIDTELARLGLV